VSAEGVDRLMATLRGEAQIVERCAYCDFTESASLEGTGFRGPLVYPTEARGRLSDGPDLRRATGLLET
jgi:hypothetical protein